MVGAICKAEVLFHPLVTIECFGWAVFFRAVFAGRDQTFLSLLHQVGVFQRPQTPAPEFIGRCIALEQGAMRIYQWLSFHHAENERAQHFFERLSQQEAMHAELLELCRAVAGRGRWRDQGVEMWRHSVPDTERWLREVETSLERHASLADSLRLVIQMESSQINGLFTGIVQATDARFGKVFSAFRSTVRSHLDYIRREIPLLEPSLKPDCERLAAGSN